MAVTKLSRYVLPMTVEVRIPALGRLIRACSTLADREVERALRSAVTFTAKDYTAAKTGRMERDIDRPRSFTRRAYDWDGARRTGPIEARSFVKPKQAAYLRLMERGGIRVDNGRGGPIGVADEFKDAYGGLKASKARRALATKGKRVRYARFTITTKAGKRVRALWKVTKVSKRALKRARKADPTAARTRLKAMAVYGRVARYNATLGFERDGLTYGKRHLRATMNRLLERRIRQHWSDGNIT